MIIIFESPNPREQRGAKLTLKTMLSFKFHNFARLDIEAYDMPGEPSTQNPTPSKAKPGDWYERKDGRKKYILEIAGDSALFLDVWNFRDAIEIVYYSHGINRSKLSNLKKWSKG